MVSGSSSWGRLRRCAGRCLRMRWLLGWLQNEVSQCCLCISPISEPRVVSMMANERFRKPKNRLTLVGGHASRNLDDVLVESTAHELEIAEDEGLLRIESAGDDVLRVVLRVSEH